LIFKDSVKPNCNKFIYCSPFYTVSCIDHRLSNAIKKAEKILITSRNGVIGLVDNKIKTDDKLIITVGSKTHELLKSHGFTNIVDPYFDIKSLVAEVNLESTLYISGFDISFTNYKLYGIERFVIYRAIERKIPLNVISEVVDGSISHICLYSQRGAGIFLRNFPQDYNFNGIKFICISREVAKVIEKFNPIYPAIPIESEMLSLIS
jgi:uroporphyrinogen-III synthase